MPEKHILLPPPGPPSATDNNELLAASFSNFLSVTSSLSPHKTIPNMSSSGGKVFSILGKNIKANSKADLEPYLTELAALPDVEEVHFGGNSLGVEACEAIAAVLKEKKTLKVSISAFATDIR